MTPRARSTTSTLDETQLALRDLSSDLFGRQVESARIEKVEATPERFDRELWTALAEAGLLGVVVPEDAGGLGMGAVELVLVLEQFGRAVAPVPLVDASVAAWCIAAHGDDEVKQQWLPRLVAGAAVIACAPPPSTAGVRVTDGRLTGAAVGVPWAHVADAVLLTVGDDVWLLDPALSEVTPVREETSARQVALTLKLSDAPARRIGDLAAGWLSDRARVAWSAVQAGVTDAALRMTASYTSEREQFGKPLSTFQAVALKAADAYLDATAIRATTMQAAWALDHVDDPTLEVLTAAWWAAEAGQHCVHLTQHLHGGMGADVTYPVHRYFLWGKQIELMLGGSSRLLAAIGDALSTRPDAGDVLVL